MFFFLFFLNKEFWRKKNFCRNHTKKKIINKQGLLKGKHADNCRSSNGTNNSNNHQKKNRNEKELMGVDDVAQLLLHVLMGTDTNL